MNVNPKTQLKNFKTPEKSTSLAFFFEINKIFLSIIFIRQFFNLFFTNLLLVILGGNKIIQVFYNWFNLK